MTINETILNQINNFHSFTGNSGIIIQIPFWIRLCEAAFIVIIGFMILIAFKKMIKQNAGKGNIYWDILYILFCTRFPFKEKGK